MNNMEIGRIFEIKSKKIFSKKGYDIINRQKWNASYDFIIKKGEDKIYVEVKGRNGKNYSFNVSKNKIEKLKNLRKKVLFMFINSEGYCTCSLTELTNKKNLKIKGKKISVNLCSYFSIYFDDDIQEIVKEIADKEKRSDSFIVNEILQNHFKEDKK